MSGTIAGFMLLLLLASSAAADFIEIGEGGTLTTNRPFCGS
jgi:hypothetical protein